MQIFFLLLLFIFTFTFANLNVPGTDRLIISVNVKAGQSLITDIVDKNSTAWKSLGINTTEEIEQFNLDGRAFYLNQYGLDFTNATYNAFLDSWELYDNVTLYNCTSGQTYVVWQRIAMLVNYKLTGNKTYRVKIDSENLVHGMTGEWYRNHFGTLVLMSGNGTFTSVAAGTKWSDQDILGYNIWYFLKENADWSKQNNRQIFVCFSEYPTLEPRNSQGFTEVTTRQTCHDEQGRKYYAVSIADTFKDYVTGEQMTVTTTTMNSPPWQV